jgi:UDP-N-acetylmuramate: L-alanyl-gamma-D-glutamyl-meso-diaminopimelate ligase
MEPRHYHLIGIGGTAMASLAGLLRAAGHRVTGSDAGVYPPMSDLLDRLGIRYHEGYQPANLDPVPDMVVVGNAISRGNPELEHVLDARLHYTSAAETIREAFLRGRRTLAVAGTHGKTTTTSLVAWILERCGLQPSFLVGGIAENFGTSFRLAEGEWFVIEADEYDTAYFDKSPKMWHYRPEVAVVTNVEFDHADIFRDAEAYRWAFSRFINLVPRSGTLVAGWDSPAVRALAPASFAPVESFACDEEGDPRGEGHPRWRAADLEFAGDRTRFRVLRGDVEWGIADSPLPGRFNVQNALAALAAAASTGADRDGILEGLASFRSVRRRMEVRGVVGGVTVIDDFAHHPTAVRETIRAARQRYPDRRLVAIFEPRSYTAQRRESQADYEAALGQADEIVIAGLFHPERYTRDTAIDPAAMVETWRAAGRIAHHIPEPDRIAERIGRSAGPGDVVLIMSNGGFGGLHGKLLDRLEARRQDDP